MSADERVSLDLGETSISWELPALARLAAGAADAPWSLEGELAEGGLRVLSIAGSDGTLLALAALRPPGAAGHGEETVRAVLVRDGQAIELETALLSSEHGPDGVARRVGVELYERSDSLPLRGGGRATGARAGERDGAKLEVVELATRLEGQDGVGRFEVLRPL